MWRWSRGDLAAAALAVALLLLLLVAWTRVPPRPITGFWPGWSCTYAGGEPVCVKDLPKAPP